MDLAVLEILSKNLDKLTFTRIIIGHVSLLKKMRV